MNQNDYEEIGKILNKLKLEDETYGTHSAESIRMALTQKLADYFERESKTLEDSWESKAVAKEHRFNREQFKEWCGVD